MAELSEAVADMRMRALAARRQLETVDLVREATLSKLATMEGSAAAVVQSWQVIESAWALLPTHGGTTAHPDGSNDVGAQDATANRSNNPPPQRVVVDLDRDEAEADATCRQRGEPTVAPSLPLIAGGPTCSVEDSAAIAAALDAFATAADGEEGHSAKSGRIVLPHATLLVSLPQCVFAACVDRLNAAAGGVGEAQNVPTCADLMHQVVAFDKELRTLQEQMVLCQLIGDHERHNVDVLDDEGSALMAPARAVALERHAARSEPQPTASDALPRRHVAVVANNNAVTARMANMTDDPNSVVPTASKSAYATQNPSTASRNGAAPEQRLRNLSLEIVERIRTAPLTDPERFASLNKELEFRSSVYMDQLAHIADSLHGPPWRREAGDMTLAALRDDRLQQTVLTAAGVAELEATVVRLQHELARRALIERELSLRADVAWELDHGGSSGVAQDSIGTTLGCCAQLQRGTESVLRKTEYQLHAALLERDRLQDRVRSLEAELAERIRRHEADVVKWKREVSELGTKLDRQKALTHEAEQNNARLQMLVAQRTLEATTLKLEVQQLRESNAQLHAAIHERPNAFSQPRSASPFSALPSARRVPTVDDAIPAAAKPPVAMATVGTATQSEADRAATVAPVSSRGAHGAAGRGPPADSRKSPPATTNGGPTSRLTASGGSPRSVVASARAAQGGPELSRVDPSAAASPAHDGSRAVTGSRPSPRSSNTSGSLSPRRRDELLRSWAEPSTASPIQMAADSPNAVSPQL